MFYISNLTDLRDALNRLRGDDRTVICTLVSPPGTDEWYACVSNTANAAMPVVAGRSGSGKGARIEDAIGNAIEDFIANGGRRA